MSNKVLERINHALESGTEYLDLSALGLTKVPPEIGKLTKLIQLRLEGNQLTTLPPEIGKLTNLTVLDLQENHLPTLPPEIGKLTKLTKLNLIRNQLTTLPPEIGKLTKLTELSLRHNQLTTLPPEITKLANLSELWLEGNQLTTLVEIGKLTNLSVFDLATSQLTTLPAEITKLTKLTELWLEGNQLTNLPPEIGKLTNLSEFYLQNNQLTTLPAEITKLTKLTELYLEGNQLTSLPPEIAKLTNLTELYLQGNQLTTLPPEFGKLTKLTNLDLDGNPLNPELASVCKDGLDALKTYLRTQLESQIILNEAKLILVGEGEVGKTCLLDALRGDPWQKHATTHGIQIKPVKVIDPESNGDITLNGWDFGGQRVYRPTHQLFFSAPAVYLVVWKPREGPQQGLVKEWVKLIIHREPDAKILIVSTHGGPQQRQPDIDRQEFLDLFGEKTILGFFRVENRPDKDGKRHGIDELKTAVAKAAVALPEMGRSVPKRWQEVREALKNSGEAYLPLARLLELCHEHEMEVKEARLFVSISHRLGHLIHYEHDPVLRDMVVLKPDWLATAISFVLDDEVTRERHGLVRFSRLSQLWDDPDREPESRYPQELHPIFMRLMERFDLSYRVQDAYMKEEASPACLIGQLVPDTRPVKQLAGEWPSEISPGYAQQKQICQIVDSKGQSETAEGLFYQLIVRLHKFSLGRLNYKDSVHWQRGLVLDNDYNGRALLLHIGKDIHITVRAPYPDRLLTILTTEVKYLVDNFWEGLRCKVMVPCVAPCGEKEPGTGLYEVEKLIESKGENRPEFPYPLCGRWQNIDSLLRNAPAAKVVTNEELMEKLVHFQQETMGRFDTLGTGQKEILSKIDAKYAELLQVFTDEAREGPRLFSFEPVQRSNFNPKKWIKTKFCFTLWCEYSRLPLPSLDDDPTVGIIDIELTRDWFKKAAPYLKLLTSTLSLILPVVASGAKLGNIGEEGYKTIAAQIDLGKEVINAALAAPAKVGEFLNDAEAIGLKEHQDPIRAQGSALRELHVLLKKKDPTFGGLVRVLDKRRQFLWVHPQFEGEY
ncbi:MAG: COR domain-containing protein [Acidobacteriota bacterium]|nr:COR domain-containing protein [Acidobacteriota bacterium]